jgi:hypothetical protein
MSIARKGVWTALVAVVCAVGLLAGAGSALAETKTFKSTGKEQEFKVPAGVTSVSVTAVGAKGGEGHSGVSGGFGALVSAQLTVTPGHTLYVEVGSNGCTSKTILPADCVSAVFGGGGAAENDSGTGGGASDVREKPEAEGAPSLLSRLLVAGGGGGGGSDGVGGPAGGPGGPGDAEPLGIGGAGENGRSAELAEGGEGGKGATKTEGGKGGKGGKGESENENGPSGEGGALGVGGRGSVGPSEVGGGGGGGGGLYGGGAGGAGGLQASRETTGGGGGGGAGSSFVVPSGSGVTLAKDTTGTPEVTFTYTAPASALAAILVSDSIGQGPGHALADKAGAIQAAVKNGQTAIACTDITDYLDLVKAQTDKKLTETQASELTTDATNLAAALGC